MTKALGLGDPVVGHGVNRVGGEQRVQKMSFSVLKTVLGRA